MDPIVYADHYDEAWTRRPKRAGLRPAREILRDMREEDFEPQGYTFELVARDFASAFGVSVQAMRIRLEELGLLLVDHPPSRDLFAGS